MKVYLNYEFKYADQSNPSPKISQIFKDTFYFDFNT